MPVIILPSWTSSTVYLISVCEPVTCDGFLYFGNSSNVNFHPAAAFVVAVNSLPSFITASPSANNLTVIESGLRPSWLSASSHTFEPSILTISGVWVLVIL